MSIKTRSTASTRMLGTSKTRLLSTPKFSSNTRTTADLETLKNQNSKSSVTSQQASEDPQAVSGAGTDNRKSSATSPAAERHSLQQVDAVFSVWLWWRHNCRHELIMMTLLMRCSYSTSTNQDRQHTLWFWPPNTAESHLRPVQYCQ